VRAQECIDDDEDRAFALFERSRTHYQQGRFEEAIALLDEAYALCPIPVLIYNLARSHEANGEWGEAIGFYERFLQAAPDTPDRAGIERRIETMRAELDARAAVRPSPRSPSPIPWIVAGVGVVALGTGAVLGAVAEATAGEATDEPVHLRRAELAATADDYALAANVTLIAGALVAVGGAVWGIFDLIGSRSETEDERGEGRAALHIDVSPRGGQLRLSGIF
jgi:tetratricopeptide (TPR) repeat protein